MRSRNRGSHRLAPMGLGSNQAWFYTHRTHQHKSPREGGFLYWRRGWDDSRYALAPRGRRRLATTLSRTCGARLEPGVVSQPPTSTNTKVS